jgi:4-amino-4-deoxy-L-arabinose transferase-like glycosyltransferase
MEAPPKTIAAARRPPDGSQAAVAPSISLVLPAYNEEAAIAAAIAEADAALSRVTDDYEIIVVDDGSSDHTADRAREVGLRNASVRVVSHQGNQGYGAALRTGFHAATKQLVGFTDADCQFDLTELDRLVMLSRHYDLVCGYRIDRQDHWHRKFFSKGYSTLVSLLLGTRVRDCDCALKLMRREEIVKLPLESRGFFINAEMLAQARLHELSLVEVGVSHRPRNLGESKVSLRHIFPVLRALLPFWWTKVMFPRPAAANVSETAGDGPMAALASRSWQFWVVLAAAVLLLFANLSYPLIEPDESRYALISATMLESGDYVVPLRDGEPYLDKPPLLYWLAAASFRCFGVHDYAARYVTAAAALATLLATYLLGKRLIGRRAAMLAAVVLLLSVGFVLSGRFLIMDGLLTAFTTICILSLCLATREPRLRLGWWVLAAVACGLGVLTKGPVAVVVCLPALLASRWLTGNTAPLRVREWGLFAAVALGVAAPWFVLASLREPDFLEYFFWKHNVVRFVSTFSHQESWWYYLPAIALGMFPASMLLPFLPVFLAIRSPRIAQRRTWELGYLLLATVWIIAFFSLSSGKLAPYILPAMPPLALVAGRMLDVCLISNRTDPFFARVAGSLPFHAARLALLTGMGVGVASLVLSAQTRGEQALGVAVILGCVAGFALVSRKSLRHRPGQWLAAACAPAAVIGFSLAGLYPQLAAWRSTAWDVARVQVENHEQATPVASYPRVEDSLLFYNRGQQVCQFPDTQINQLVEFLQSQPRVLFVSSRNNIINVRRLLPPSVTLTEVEGTRGRIYVSISREAAGPLSASRPGPTVE